VYNTPQVNVVISDRQSNPEDEITPLKELDISEAQKYISHPAPSKRSSSKKKSSSKSKSQNQRKIVQKLELKRKHPEIEISKVAA
jgi:hypothetical protein